MFKRAPSLEKLVEEAKAQTEEAKETLRLLIEEQGTIHKFVFDQVEFLGELLRENIQANAELFNAAAKDAERDLRLELDRLYRQQVGVYEQLRKLPLRE